MAAGLLEFTGKDLEEAIAVAAAALNLPPEKVKFNLLTMGSKGFLGLGRRKARISVDPSDPALNLGEEAGEPPKAGPPVKAAEPAEPAPKAGPDKRAPKATRPAKPAAEDRKKALEAPSARPAEGAEVRALDWAHVPPPPTRPGPGEEEQAEPQDDQAGQLAETVVREIIGRMGLEVECRRRRIGPRIVISLDSPDKALLIGNRGSTLEALQLLAAKIMLRRSKSAEPESASAAEDRLVLDVADYRFRRQAQLLENLKNLAEEARASRKPQALGGLSPAERRLVLLALRPFKDLAVTAGGGRDALTITVASGQRPQRPSRPRRQHRPRRAPKPSS